MTDTSPGVLADTSDLAGVGYRLQLTLVDLVDLTLQTQHLRWNLFDQPGMRRRLDDFDALTRAAADEVAQRMRELGLSPDSRIATNYHDLLFDQLPAGPFTEEQGVAAFTHRLTQFAGRLRDSIDYFSTSDAIAASIVTALQDEIRRWTENQER